MKGTKRLLILDGYGSHHTYEFVNYAENNHIVLFGLPPHLTHLLQPLDVVVFQPLKHWHSQAIDLLIRDGIEQITKLEFLQIIQDIRKKAFKETTIKSAFRKTGIWPFNPSIVIDYMRQLHPREATPIESAWSESENSQLFSSPFKEPETQRQFNMAGCYAMNSLKQLMEGPDSIERAQYHISSVVHGAEALAVLHEQLKERLSRVEATQNNARRNRESRRRYLQP